MLDCIQRVTAIIRKNLEWSPITEQQKQAVIDDEIARMQELDTILDGEKSAEEEEDDPLTSQGEKLSALKARAHKEWEDWKQ